MAQVSRVANEYTVLGVHTLTTAFITSATHTTYQDEGLTLSVTYLPSRILRVSVNLNPIPSGALQSMGFQVLRSATSLREFLIHSAALSAAAITNGVFSHTFNGPATGATETFKLQVKAIDANTSVQSFGSAAYPRQLIVEDLGSQ